MPSPATTLSARTVQLQREYSWSINSAIEAGRPELAAELADCFHTDLAELAREHQPATNPRGIVLPR